MLGKIKKCDILNYQIRHVHVISHFVISERLLKPPKSDPENLIEVKITDKGCHTLVFLFVCAGQIIPATSYTFIPTNTNLASVFAILSTR